MTVQARTFRGDSPAIAQVTLLTPLNVLAGDVFTIFCGGESISYIAAAASAADVSKGLVALLQATSIAVFKDFAAVDLVGSIQLTANTPGVPFVVTTNSSVTQSGNVTVAETTPGKLAVNEVHQINLVGAYTGGTFTITQTVPGQAAQTTGAIAYNASAATVQAALAALTGVGAAQVVVTGGPGPSAAWFVQWTGTLGGQSIAPGTINGASLLGAGAVTVVETTLGNGLSDDIQILDTTGSIAQPADVSTYTLSLDGQATVALGDPRTAPVSAAALQTALQNLPNVGAGNVLVYAANNQNGVQQGIYVIHFTGALAGAHVSTLVVGGWAAREPAPVITKVQNGGLTTSDDFQWIDLGIAATASGTGGTVANFTVTYQGKTTPPIENVTNGFGAPSLQAALQNLSTIGANNCTVYGPSNIFMTSQVCNGYLVRLTGAKANTRGSNYTVASTSGSPAVTRISNGLANVNEVQTITIFGTGGTFTLSVGGQTTAAIAFNALAATVQTRIQTDLANTITACTVTGAGTIASPYVVTVTNPGNKAIAVMTGSGASLTGGGGTDVELTAGAAGVSEVQTVTEGAGINGGTFTLSFNGATTPAQAWNVTAANLQTALQALSTINTVTVAGAAGGPYTVTWSGAQGNSPQPLLAGNGNNLTGATGTQTFGVSTSVFSSGPDHYNDPLNWSPQGVPNSGDAVYFDPGSSGCLYGLDQISTFTVNTGTNLGTWAKADLLNGQVVYLTTTGALPTGLAINTPYYLVNVNRDAGTFQLSATPGGSAIVMSSVGTGVHTLGIRLASLEGNSRYTGNVGLSRENAGGYFEYRTLYLHIGFATAAQIGAPAATQTATIGTGNGSGSGKFQLDTDVDQVTLKVINTGGSAESGIPALLWKGQHAANVLAVIDGDVGVALFPGETAVLGATAPANALTQRAGKIELGNGVTLTGNIDKTGGDMRTDNCTINGSVLWR